MTTQIHAQYRIYIAESEGHYITLSTVCNNLMQAHESVYLRPGESMLHPYGALVMKTLASQDAGLETGHKQICQKHKNYL